MVEAADVDVMIRPVVEVDQAIQRDSDLAVEIYVAAVPSRNGTLLHLPGSPPSPRRDPRGCLPLRRDRSSRPTLAGSLSPRLRRPPSVRINRRNPRPHLHPETHRTATTSGPRRENVVMSRPTALIHWVDGGSRRAGTSRRGRTHELAVQRGAIRQQVRAGSVRQPFAAGPSIWTRQVQSG